VGEFAKRNAGLSHAIGPWTHAEKESLLFSCPKLGEVVAMPFPRVFEGIVGASNRLGKFETAKLLAEFVGRLDEGVHF